MKLLSDNVSIYSLDKKIRYNEIDGNILKVYDNLRREELLQDKTIALYIDRSEQVIYLILAILTSESCYVPLDTAIPDKRIENMVEISQASCIITNRRFTRKFKGYKIPVYYIEDWLEENRSMKICGDFACSKSLGKGIAYIIFTSGTTGEPKGVVVSKESLRNFLTGSEEELYLKKCRCMLFATSISFDIFHVETVFALYLGLSVVVASDLEQKNPRLLIKRIKKSKVDTIQCTPSRMQQLIKCDKSLEFLNNIKCLIIGGENLPSNLVETILKHKKIDIYNAYGPTEATIWISYSKVRSIEDINIGRALKNNSFYIVDENNKIVKDGEIGEICIEGKNLFEEYINDINLTKKKKIIIKATEEVMVYKTGDVGYLRGDGNHIILGRKDNQLKVNGYRVELEEIESCAQKHKGVEHALVIAEKQYENKYYLRLLYSSSEEIKDIELKEWLMCYLPRYMMPNEIIRIKNFCYSSNGKIDRKAMSERITSLNRTIH